MPAASSSTIPEWQLSLQKLALRNGVLELTPADAKPANTARIIADDNGALTATTQVIWRVRLLKIEGASLIVERPSSAHQPVVIKPGESVIGLVVEGATRWSLTMDVVEQFSYALNASQSIIALRLKWPRV